MTITSFTSDKKYETTLTSCSCPARHFNPGKPCKHMRMIEEEVEKAATFLSLKQRYEQPERLYSEVCGHLVKSDTHRHCGCMA